MIHFQTHWHNWLLGTGIILVSIAVALVVHYFLFSILARIARRPGRIIDASFVRHGRKPAKWILPLLALLIVVPLAPLSPGPRNAVEHVIGVGLIVAVAWIVIVMTEVFTDLVAARYRIDVADNLEARRIQTQVNVLRRIFTVVVLIVALSIILLSIPQVRSIGTSLLASAGLAGLVIGMAMKSTLGNLIAGIQIALTQPIRMEDAVIVEGEWGWIEEITSTYVVVRLWDWRRMVLPLSYFIEHPFQNWTRITASLIGSVYLYVDYTVPVDEVRKELDRIVKTTDKWRGEVCVLQVSDTKEYTIELRALADAKDAGTAWDLRCYIREGLIKFLQEKYPQSLPKTRAELNAAPQQTRVA
ncbi:MAG: mechanosensitive ion channel family protein [Terriglobia bacterium]